MAAEKSHTKRWQRIVIFFIAMLFVATSAALTITVILQAVSGSKNSSQTAANQPKPNAKQLQGTELASFTPVQSVPKLQVVDQKQGSGKVAKTSNTITVNYTGAVAATGKIFQSSLDTGQPATFPLSKVIKGWQEGIPGMKVGGQRRLIIPANEAYGATPPPNSGIPANAPLVFDITLLKIDK